MLFIILNLSQCLDISTLIEGFAIEIKLYNLSKYDLI